MRLFLAVLVCLLPFVAQAQPGGGVPTGAVSNSTVIATGGTTARTLADWMAPFVGSTTAALFITAPTTSVKTYDGTIQFNIGLTPGATEYWNCLGGNTGTGGTCYATNGTAPATGNVNGNFVTQNAGNFFFATGAGTAAEIADPGAASTSYPVLTPGTATTNPIYGSTANTQIDAPSGDTVYFTVGGIVMGAAKNLKSIVATTNYPTLYGATGATGMACVNAAASGAVNCFIQAQSTGSVSFGNSSGSLATFSNSSANTAVDFFIFKASSTTVPLQITGGASTSVGIGTPSLAASATAGFSGMPTCAAAAGPTGTPAQTAGWGYQCYNPTTHNLNIYDPVAASWYHILLLVGAG